MGWTNQQTDSLTLPPGSTGAPRIFLGSGDPFATAAGALAALMFYWNTDEAMMIDIRETGGDTGHMRFSNTDASGIVAVFLEFLYNEATGVGTVEIGAGSNVVDVTGADFQYDGTSLGRNNRSVASSGVASGAVGAETVVLTVPSTTYISGRAYAVRIGGRISSSVANNAQMRLRQGTTTAGTLLIDFGAFPVTNTAFFVGAHACRYIKVDSTDPDVTTSLVLTLQASAGTSTHAANVNDPRFVEVVDVGADSDFPNAVFL